MNRKYLFVVVILQILCLLALCQAPVFSQAPPPLLINNGAKFINHPERKVELRISMPQAAQMMISNNSEFTGVEWENYKTSKPDWILEDTDGNKSVFIKFKDATGKESKAFQALTVLDRLPPKDPKIIINKDAPFCTNTLKIVGLKIYAQEADQMMISNDSSFAGTKWMNYADSLNNWILGEPDGEKSVWVRFKDKAGNITKGVKDKIIMDRIPPTDLSLKINDGALWTNQDKVRLTIQAKGVSEMMLKEPNPKWKPYAPEITDFILTGEDGVKGVFVRLRDEAGNLSNPLSAQIKLDRVPPSSARIQIDNGVKYTSNLQKKITLRLMAQDALEMMVGEDSTFQNIAWESYKTTLNLTLKGEDGTRVIYAKFKDQAGNVSSWVKDDIILDRSTPEEGSLQINTGQASTNNTNVILQIKAKDALQMVISGNETFLGALWEKFTPEKPFILQGIDGEKTVYVKLKDAAGNMSTPIKATILLDRKPPLAESIKIDEGAPFTTSKENKVMLTLTAPEAVEMMISNTNDFKGGQWEAFKATKEWKLSGEDGIKVVGAKFRDQAGNISNIIIAKINLVKSAVISGKFNINGDSLYTRNPHKRVDLVIDASGAKEMMASNSAEFSDGKWEVFKPHKIWTLPGEDGEKIVYMKFKGYVGNESKVCSDKIILDRDAPSDGKIIIHYDSTKGLSKITQVKLTIYAKSAAKMMVSNNPVFQGAQWEPYKTTKMWQLDKNDGIKHVFIKFKDEPGNESAAVSDKILLDKMPPQNVGLSINNEAAFTSNPNKAVTLVFKATDATGLRISNSPNPEGSPWEKMSNKKLNWILPGEDGEKTVYVQYKDESENMSEVAFDKIILDRKPPRNCNFTINNDSLYTNDPVRNVRLQIKGEDVSSILISNQRDFFGARWESFKAFKANWILDGSDGDKTIYMLFKDEAGNVFPDTVKHKIILDKVPPANSALNINGGAEKISDASRKVTLDLKSEGADFMEIRNQKEAPGKWVPFKSSIEWTLDEGAGEKTVWVHFKDQAGNVSEFVSDTILLEAQ